MTQEQQATFTRVQTILQRQLGEDVKIEPTTDLLTDLGMESLEQVELGLQLEKEFATTLPIAELRSCVTVEEIVDLLQQKAAVK